MARFWGIEIGPFVVGEVSDGRRRRRSNGERLIIWLIVGALFVPAAPLLGLAIIALALFIYTALAVAAADREDTQS